MVGLRWSAVAFDVQLNSEKHQNWLLGASQYRDVHTMSINTSKSGSGLNGYVGQSGTVSLSAATLRGIPSTHTCHSNVSPGVEQSQVTLTTSANDPPENTVGWPRLTGAGMKLFCGPYGTV